MDDDYTGEMMDLKALVTRYLENKGVLAKIRAELRSSLFEAIEEEDRAHDESEDDFLSVLLGNCNDRAKELHSSPLGKLLTALVCEYLEWAQLHHTLKVYIPECNLEKGSWKAVLGTFRDQNESETTGRNTENYPPRLLKFLEGYQKYEPAETG